MTAPQIFSIKYFFSWIILFVPSSPNIRQTNKTLQIIVHHFDDYEKWPTNEWQPIKSNRNCSRSLGAVVHFIDIVTLRFDSIGPREIMMDEWNKIRCWNEFIRIRFADASLQRSTIWPLAIPFCVRRRYVLIFIRFPESHSTNSSVESTIVNWWKTLRTDAVSVHLIQSIRVRVVCFCVCLSPICHLSDAMRDECVNSMAVATTAAYKWVKWSITKQCVRWARALIDNTISTISVVNQFLLRFCSVLFGSVKTTK